jgi:mitogen-activated protein kinase kinase kinase 9
VAIKEIKREIVEQEKLEEFKNECAAMEVLRHPNVVLFYGACTKFPNLCIILEYCQRGSLWNILHDNAYKISWEFRKKIALDMAKGVYYLHTNKILHRDLKSLNILLDVAYTAKLADFGWTRMIATKMTAKIGTYQWMAPEVIDSNRYTEKADVFSYGVILWELATRKPPYYGIDGQEVAKRVVHEGLRPSIRERDCPGPFLELMTECWDRDPNKRPQFAEIIKSLEAMNFKNIGA